MLVVIGGLPGTGKTTIARLVAEQVNAIYIRIDAIEQALRVALELAADVGDAGYVVAYAISEANLALGHTVVADCVNPLTVTRAAWRNVAKETASPIVEVEVTCSDATEHRRRVERREIDIPGLVAPTWAAVMARDYEPWAEPRVAVDTAQMTAVEAAFTIVEAVRRRLSEVRNDR